MGEVFGLLHHDVMIRERGWVSHMVASAVQNDTKHRMIPRSCVNRKRNTFCERALVQMILHVNLAVLVSIYYDV